MVRIAGHTFAIVVLAASSGTAASGPSDDGDSDWTASPVPYSRFAYFISEPSTAGWYGDGYCFDGPFYARGPVRIGSMTDGRDGDPWFYSFATSAEYYLLESGDEHHVLPHPPEDDLWIEPFELMEKGEPYFVLGADPVAFGPDSVDWQSTRKCAQSSGLFLEHTRVPDRAWLVISGDTLLILGSYGDSPGREVHLEDLAEPVIWIENSQADRIYIRTRPGDPGEHALGRPLTIGTMGDIYIAGPVLCDTTGSGSRPGGLLGLITVYGDVVFADDRDDSRTFREEEDRSARFDTDGDFEVHSSIMILSGELYAENYWNPRPPVVVRVVGSIQLVGEGFTATTIPSGFNWHVSYDPRLFETSPPHYPCFTP